MVRTIEIIVAVFGIAMAALMIWKWVSRHRRNLDDVLRPIVEGAGLRLVGSAPAPPFRSGPFPRFRVAFGRPDTQILGISGEYTTYRVVRVQTADGAVHQAWVRLRYEVFLLHESEWRPTLESIHAKRGSASIQ